MIVWITLLEGHSGDMGWGLWSFKGSYEQSILPQYYWVLSVGTDFIRWSRIYAGVVMPASLVIKIHPRFIPRMNSYDVY
jgi:hypothetical protein